MRGFKSYHQPLSVKSQMAENSTEKKTLTQLQPTFAHFPSSSRPSITRACHLFRWSLTSEFQSVLCNWRLPEVSADEIDVQSRMKTEEACSCTSCST